MHFSKFFHTFDARVAEITRFLLSLAAIGETFCSGRR
jgi:hypothetical protein